MAKYFELTDETKVNEFGVTLHRIRCTRDMAWANAGDLGGWVEYESNLCDDAWVGDEAQVFGNASVCGSAIVYGSAWVYGVAFVDGLASVYGSARVYENACVYGCSKVFGRACVHGQAQVFGSALVFDDSLVCGVVSLRGYDMLGSSAVVSNNDQHCGFDYFGSENRHTHAYLTKSGGVDVICGCFRGSLDEFAQQVHERHAGTVYERQYLAMIDMIKLKFGLRS